MAKAATPGARHLLERGVVAVRIHDGDDQRALLVVGEFVRRRAAHLEHDVGVLGDVVGDLRAGRFEVGVGNAGGDARAARDRDLGAERLEFLDGFRRCGDARLAGVGFTRYGNSHSRLPASREFRQCGDSPVKAKIRKQMTKDT